RRELTRRVDEADGVEVSIALRARQPADDLSGLRVREHQLDAEEIGLAREERHVLAVRALRRTDVELVALLRRDYQPAGAVGVRAPDHLACIERLVRRGPVLRQRIARETQRT